MQTKEVVEFDLIDMGAASSETRGPIQPSDLDGEFQGRQPVELSLND